MYSKLFPYQTYLNDTYSNICCIQITRELKTTTIMHANVYFFVHNALLSYHKVF